MKNYGMSIALGALVLGVLTGGIAGAREPERDRERRGGEPEAVQRREGHEGPREGPRWRGEDLDRWHRGHWFHGAHGGRLAWWWVVGDTWYSYPAPVYPVPDPYAPPGVAPVPPGPSVSSWYYCASANAYYPYVTQCPEPWRPTPAQP